VALSWLLKLNLPRIDERIVDDCLSEFRQILDKSSKDLEYQFFDATLDIGIPTVYALRVASHSAHAHTLVACASAPSFANAIEKTFRDLVALEAPFRRSIRVPARFEEFTALMHGAGYMARKEQAKHFAHLGRVGVHPESSKAEDRLQGEISLSQVLNRLKKLRYSAYAVDLTSDEALRRGLRIVKVIVPGLQPVSFRHAARFLAHRRLYELPSRLGFPIRPEASLNPMPQPFA
jgi:ribosomal protein S12 methylthiotransferase accessory factor